MSFQPVRWLIEETILTLTRYEPVGFSSNQFTANRVDNVIRSTIVTLTIKRKKERKNHNNYYTQSVGTVVVSSQRGQRGARP